MRKLLVTVALIGLRRLDRGPRRLGQGLRHDCAEARRPLQDRLDRGDLAPRGLKENLDLMMTLWAPNATSTIGGKTYRGKPAIRQVLSKAGPFQPQNHWSPTPGVQDPDDLNGNTGTLYFECPLRRRRHREGGRRGGRGPGRAEDQRQVADHEADLLVGDAEAVAGCGMSVAANTPRSDDRRAPAFTRADNPVVRSVARLPAKLRTKLLAAFLAIAALLVLVLAPRRPRSRPGELSAPRGSRRCRPTGRATQAIEAQATIVRDIIGLLRRRADVFKFATAARRRRPRGPTPACGRRARS